MAAARLGAPTAFVGAVGEDPFGVDARAALAAEGVDLTGLRAVPAPTGIALIIVDARGENTIAVAPGANEALTPTHVGEAMAALRPMPGDVVLVGHEIPTATAREALVLAGRAGATTVLNPAPAAGVDRSTFGLADVLTPNRGELATIAAADARRIGRAAPAGERPEIAARRLLESSPEGDGVRRAVIVTLGPAGAVLVQRDGPPLDLPPLAVDALDTVGAGDTFAGALAAGLAAGRPVEEAARRAIVAAALSTTRAGAREGMPTAEELEAALGGR